jgi:hypothetical protein
VVAREDVLAYLIPAEQVERLRRRPGLEALLARRPATGYAGRSPPAASPRPWTCSACAPASWSTGR